MITRIAHVCLNVKDLDASMVFYEKALKLKRKFNFVRKGKPIGAYFEVSKGNYIEMFQKDLTGVTNTGITHFCLETDDIDALAAWLEQSKVKTTAKKLGCDQSYQIWLNDPDGNAIEIHQYTKQSAQLKGGDVEVTW
jgi:lactoylglutathione lyase